MAHTNHYAINWTDGVKITKDHFTESYFNTVENIREATAAQIHTYDYGLLKSRENAPSSLELEIHTHTQERLEIRLQNCNAVTAGGCRIEFSSMMYGEELPAAIIESKDIDVNSNLEFYLMLTVNPFELVPIGEPDPEVIPLHHPYVLPKINLNIIPENQFNTNFFEKYYLLVGKIQWKNGSFIIDQKYIPPVSRIRYHKSLHAFSKRIAQVLINLRNYSIIIQKKNKEKYQTNSLVRNTFSLTNKVMDFVSQHTFEFNQLIEEQPPIYIAQKVSILANYLSTALAIMEEVDKEKLLQYYYEWIDVKPSDFESTLGDLIGLQYDHNDINKMIDTVDYFIAIIDRLWKRLSDLEYIGQRKDNIVISEESISIKEPEKSRSWSIID
ncbi:hypothetical protein [Aquimarina rhabdastrellae]